MGELNIDTLYPLKWCSECCATIAGTLFAESVPAKIQKNRNVLQNKKRIPFRELKWYNKSSLFFAFGG